MQKLILILALVIFSTDAVAQPTDEEIGELATFFTLFPELRTLPRPEIVASGTRVTYSAAGASPGSAGGGVIQYDIVATDPAQVMVHQHSYGDVVGGLQPLSQGVAQGVPGLGPFWIHPSVLERAESVASPTLSVTRVDKEVAGATRTIVRFQTQTTNGRTVYEFSAASGLLTFSSISSGGGDAQLNLISTRELARPWQANATPNWAQAGSTLEYSGTITTTIDGIPAPAQAISATLTIDRSTNRWSTFDGVTMQQNLGQGMTRSVSGVAQQTGAVWLPTSARAATLPAQPQTIDTDPVTGAIVTMSQSDGQIFVTQTLPAGENTWIYDASLGVLEQQITRVQTINGFQETVLSRTGGADLAALDEQGSLPEVAAPVGGGESGGSSKSSSDGCQSVQGQPHVLILLVLVGLLPSRRIARARRLAGVGRVLSRDWHRHTA